MYLHLGSDSVVREEEIVGIFDLDSATVRKGTRLFLRRADAARQTALVSSDLPKSFVITAAARAGDKDARRGIGQKVYLTLISTATLRRRIALKNGF